MARKKAETAHMFVVLWFKNASKKPCPSLNAGVALLAATLLASCGGAPAPIRQAPAPLETASSQTSEDAAFPDTDVAETKALDQDEEPNVGSVEVALMLPLSGPVAETGQALLRAATLALFDAYDPRIRLLPVDTKGDLEVTRIEAEKLATSGVSIVLGPLLAENVRLAGEVLTSANIPLVGFSNDSTVAASDVLIMGFLPETEVKRVADYAVSKGLTNFGALVPEGLYGERVQTALGDALVDAGGFVSAIESYPPDADALFEPVKRLAKYDERRQETRREVQYLRSLRDDLTNEIAARLEEAEVMEGVEFDAVIVPEGGALMRTLGPLLPYYEIDPNRVKLLGTGLWNNPALLGEPPLQGAWFAAPDPEAPTAFLARYESVYGGTAPRIATLAYDAISLVAVLAKEAVAIDSSNTEIEDGAKEVVAAATVGGGDRRFDLSKLKRPEGFSGIDGVFRFLPDGTNERSLAILEINRQRLRVLDPALNGFPSFGYALKVSN